MEAQGNFFEGFINAFKEKKESMGNVNIIIAGKTGIGKSTLINAAFSENLAETGIGQPITKEMKLYQKDSYPLRIYDTVGFELKRETFDASVGDIKNLIAEKIKQGNVNDCIHCVWYCVNAMGDRFEPEECDFINAMAEVVPVIIVLTKTYTKSKAEILKAEILKYNLPAKNIVITLAQDFDDDGTIKPAFGVDTLVEITNEILPESQRDAWVNVQKASRKLKRQRANILVATTAAASFGEGFIPVPFSDCVALIPTEVGMLATITVIYGFEISKSIITGVVSSIIGTAGTTLIGRTVVSNLLKLIPGVGTVAGGTISGATAALLTTALGEAYIAVMDQMLIGEITEKNISDDNIQKKIKSIFMEKLNSH